MATQLNPGTPQQIEQIHIKKIATPGVLYYETTGRVFRGQLGGYLKEVKDLVTAENTIIDHTATIDNHEERITSSEVELERLESVKADKCLAIAMGIVL